MLFLRCRSESGTVEIGAIDVYEDHKRIELQFFGQQLSTLHLWFRGILVSIGTEHGV